jgi:hypothetical protein
MNQIESQNIYNVAKAEERRKYIKEYNRKNYESKLKNTKQKCEICQKDYNITNKWKHNSSKFHIFFKELIETRGLNPKDEIQK